MELGQLVCESYTLHGNQLQELAFLKYSFRPYRAQCWGKTTSLFVGSLLGISQDIDFHFFLQSIML